MRERWTKLALLLSGVLVIGEVMDEELAARRLAAAKARVILAEHGTNPAEFTDALIALDRAEHEYVEAVNR